MVAAGGHCRQIVLPAIRQAIAAHAAGGGCAFADGADERALAAVIKSLKADEIRCDEPEDELEAAVL